MFMVKRVAWLVALVALLFLVACGGEGEKPGDAGPPVPGTIVFDSIRDGSYEIYAMNTDGSAQTRITNDGTWNRDPSCSPDGAKIAFTSYRDGNTEVYVMNADGSVQVNITQNGGGSNQPFIEQNLDGDDGAAAWSPDGANIAFGSVRPGTVEFPRSGSEIYLMNSDGTGQTRFTAAGTAGPAAWSPDGSTLAFVNSYGSYELHVVEATADQGPLGFEALPESKVIQSKGPGATAWSPDGTKIAFSSLRLDKELDTRDQFRHYEIYVVNVDGTGLTNLTDNDYADYAPTWSPDGSSIAFASRRHGKENPEIYVMNADGSGKRRLTDNDSRDENPHWCPAVE